MGRGVPLAFIGASVADCRAPGTELAGKDAAPAHQGGSQSTRIRAISVELDAPCHRLDLVFLQARISAVFAFIGAVLAGFDTIFE